MDGYWAFIVVAGLLFLGIAIGILNRRERRRALMAKYADERIVDAIIGRKVWQGMTQEMLIDSRGTPEDQDETIFKTKTKRTYKYGRTGKNRFRERIYIEDGTVVGWKD
jgi:hypothetical protein